MSSISGISFGGLASGLDTQSIISQLLAIEERPIALLRNKKQTFQAKKNLFGDLEDKLGKLFEATKKLRLSSQFLEFDAATDDEDKYLKATAGAGASPGKYDIEVSELAQARTRTSNGSSDSSTTTHGSGSLMIGLPDSSFEIIPLGSATTLDEIASAVNDRNIGIEASVVNTGIGDSPYKLVLKSSEEGLDNDFTVSVDSADAALTAFAAELNNDDSIKPLDAAIKINGVDAKRSSNTITDLIQGVTIDLRAIHSVSTKAKSTITITTNAEETSEKIKEFVDAYNEIVDFITTQQEVTRGGSSSSSSDDDETEVQTNPLFGESALRTIQSTLRSIVGSSTASGSDSHSLLSQVGISSDRAGKLTFTQSDFEEALIEDPSAMRNLFASEDNDNNPVGIANRIYDTIDTWTDSIDGLIATRLDGIDRNVSDINDQIERAQDKLERYEIQLTQRYANLEVTLARLNSQLGSLTGLGSGGGQ